jgi:membrane protease YdiL (CAAX protease family)
VEDQASTPEGEQLMSEEHQEILEERATKNVTAFFVLTFVLSIPPYILAALVPQETVMLTGLIIALAPITAGLILAYQENGSGGARRLLSRSFDTRRITNKALLIPILCFWPILFFLAFGLTIAVGERTPDPLFPLVAAPILFVLFFVFALFEEVGWMGYAFDPMENSWNAFKASLLLGVIWAIWHLPLYILAGLDPLWIAGQLISLIAIRTLIVFVFNNTGKSVFAVILFHAMYNLCALLVTSFYTSTGHLITSIFIVVAALAVSLLWDPSTLTVFRFRKVERAH